MSVDRFIRTELGRIVERIDNAVNYKPQINQLDIYSITYTDVDRMYMNILKEECMRLNEQYVRLQPKGVILDANGEPHSTANIADEYIVYMNVNKRIYHTPNCRYAKTGIRINVVNLPRESVPCKVCKPSIPDTEWFEIRKEIEMIMRIYLRHKEEIEYE